MSTTLEIEYIPIKDIKPYKRNAKLHPQEQIDQIKASIKEFGFNDPIAVWHDNEIIEGHGRLIAAKQMKMKEIPIIRLDDLTDEQRRAYMLAHNQLTMNTGFDLEILTEEINSILDIDMADFGFEDFVIEEPEEEVIEDEFDEEIPEEPKSKRGEIYQLGRHRLMCGDSTNKDDVLALMGGELADLLVTDPPYGVDYEGEAGKIENDNLKDEEFLHFLEDAFRNADASMKAGSSFYIWYADSSSNTFRPACSNIGWTIRECLIWNKNSLVIGRQDYQWKHEPCLYGWKEGASHNWYSDRKQTTVLEFDRPTASKLHPTMKPVALFDYLIKNSSKKEDNILDLFAGSGTTIMACEQNNRKAFAMEYDPRFVDVIIKRWEDFTGQKAVKLT